MNPIADFLRYGLAKALRKLRAKAGARIQLLRLGPTPDAGIATAPAVLSRYGVALAANWQDKTFRYCIYATYGRDLADYLEAIEKDFVVLDIGSNQGLYALIAGRNRHCRQVLAFEPVERTFRFLSRNIELNALGSKVTAYQLAVAAQAGPATIAVDAGHSGTATLASGREDSGTGSQPIETIDAAGLDALIPADLPIVIKLDVEGFEPVVLRELAKSAHCGRIMAIFYEVDSRWSDPDTMAASLREAGFSGFDKYGRGHHYDVLATRDPAWKVQAIARKGDG